MTASTKLRTIYLETGEWRSMQYRLYKAQRSHEMIAMKYSVSKQYHSAATGLLPRSRTGKSTNPRYQGNKGSKDRKAASKAIVKIKRRGNHNKALPPNASKQSEQEMPNCRIGSKERDEHGRTQGRNETTTMTRQKATGRASRAKR